MDDRLIIGLENIPEDARCGVLTIGNFDGVHLGHKRILRAARAIAESEGLAATAMTFEPPPERILRPDSQPQRIVPPDEKARLLLEAGADRIVVARTDRMLLGLSPEEFIEQVIVKTFDPRHIVEGRNFFFGLARSGNVSTLQRSGERNGFSVEVVEPQRLDLPEGSVRVSSTLIRRLVGEGRIEDAARCLGRGFALFGDVVTGQGRGRVLEFPTANLDCGDQIVPADGVYAGRACVTGTEFPAAVSIGEKPTLGPEERTIEVNLIGAEGSFYGRRIAVRLVKRLRDQEKFENIEALKAQIAKDVEHVRELCG